MDQEDMRAVTAEVLFLRAALIELLSGIAAQSGDKDAFAQSFIADVHRRLDAVERSIGRPAFAAAFERARRQADELRAILGR